MSVVKTLQQKIKDKLDRQERGLYIVLVLPIAFACLMTFAIARTVSKFWPWYYVQWAPGLHVHHFAYGFIILAISGYLSLVFSGPKAKFFIALLYGCGLGLAFDESAMWIHLREDDLARWQYDGIVTIVTIFFVILTLQPGIQFLLRLWPKRK